MAKTFEEYESGRDTSQDTSFEEYEQIMFHTTTPSVALLNDPNDVYIRAVETQDVSVELGLPIEYSQEIADVLDGQKLERPGFLKRGFYGFINKAFVQPIKNMLKKGKAREINTQLDVLAELRKIKEEEGRDVSNEEFMEMLQKAKAKREEEIQKRLPGIELPPAKGIAEKGLEITTGVAAFVTKLAIARRFVGGSGAVSEIATFEVVNIVDEGPPGMGVLLASTLGLVGRIPVATTLGKAGKLAGQGGILASITAAEGGSPEDIAVAFFLPSVLNTLKQFPHLVRGKAFEAKIAKDVKAKGFSAKEAQSIAKSVRDAAEVRGGRMSPKKWGAKHGQVLSDIRAKYNKAVDAIIKRTTPEKAGAKAIQKKVGVPPKVAKRAIEIAAKEGVEKADQYLSQAKAGIEPTEPGIETELEPPTEAVAAPEKPVAGRKAAGAVVGPVDTLSEWVRLNREIDGTLEEMQKVSGQARETLRDKLGSLQAERNALDIGHKVREMTPEEIAEDEEFHAIAQDILNAGPDKVNAVLDILERRIGLLTKVSEGILTQEEADILTAKFVAAAKARIPEPTKSVAGRKAEIAPVAKPEVIKVEAVFEKQTKRDIGYGYMKPQDIRLSHEPDIRKAGDNVADYIEEIKETGTTKPIKVMRMKDGGYEVIDGNNRLEAYKRLNKEVPVIFEKPFKDTGWKGEDITPEKVTLYKPAEIAPVTQPEAVVKIIEHKDYTEIESIEAIPTGKGAGTKAIQELITKADETGKPIRLGVGRTNTRARALYERLGFKEIPSEDPRVTGITMEYTPAKPKAVKPKGKAGKLNLEPAQKVFNEFLKIVEPGKLVDISLGKEVSAEVIKGTHTADVARIEFNESKIKGHDKSLGELRDAVGKYSKEIQDKLMLARGTPKDKGALSVRDEALADLKKEAPELLGILKIMKQVSDAAHDKLVALAGKDNVGYVNDYYYGIYKNPEKVSNFIDHWKTTDRFKKEKKWFTYAEAKSIGQLEIRDPNPITNIQSEYMAIARLQGLTEMRDNLLETGEDKYISKNRDLLAHPTMVNDPVFKGLWVEEDLGRMINSLISTNKISRSKPLNAIRATNNFLREIKFIGSAFHHLAIIKHTMADSGYLGFLYKPTAYRFITKGFGKNDPIFQEEWYKDYIHHGGGHRYSIASEAERAFVRQLSKLTDSSQIAIKVASAPLRLPKNYVEWLFEAYIPKIKAIKYRDVVIERQKKLGRLLTSGEKVDIIKEGQNIYGMMNERIFGRSGTVTTLMRFRFMAPSFAEGNFRQIAKAIAQWGTDDTFRAGRSRADILNSFILTAIAATVGTLFLTGKPPKKPESLKDIRDNFKIDTGRVDERGRRIMIDLMSYDKDFWTIFGKPFTGQIGEVPGELFTRIGGMTAGTWELMGDLNQISQGKALYDYRGNAVVEITDPFLKRVAQLVMFETKKVVPIAVSVFQQAREKELDKLTSAVVTLMGTRPTTSEKDKRESQIIRRIFQLKSRQEQLYHYLGTIKNPREAITDYNKIVQGTLDNPVMTEKIRKEFKAEDLVIDVDRLIANRVHAHELLKVKDVPEPKNLANSKKWLKNFGIAEGQYHKHLVMYEMKHRKLIEEMKVADGDEMLKNEIARFYADKGILDRKVRGNTANDREKRQARKYSKIASNISDIATRIYKTINNTDRKRYYERIKSVLERSE